MTSLPPPPPVPLYVEQSPLDRYPLLLLIQLKSIQHEQLVLLDLTISLGEGFGKDGMDEHIVDGKLKTLGAEAEDTMEDAPLSVAGVHMCLGGKSDISSANARKESSIARLTSCGELIWST